MEIYSARNAEDTTRCRGMLTLTGLDGMGPQRLAVPSGWSSQYTMEAPGRICSAPSWAQVVQAQLSFYFLAGCLSGAELWHSGLLQSGAWQLNAWNVQAAQRPVHVGSGR